MAAIPRDVKQFKILFLLSFILQLVAKLLWNVSGVNASNFHTTWWAVTYAVIALIISFAFFVRLYDTVNILKLNSIIPIKPWIIILLQLLLTGSLVIPGMVIPIYIWIMSRKLVHLDTIKTFDATKIKFRGRP